MGDLSFKIEARNSDSPLVFVNNKMGESNFKSKTYSTTQQQQMDQQHASTTTTTTEVKNHFPAANNSMQKVNGVKHEFENNGEATNNITGFGKGR